MSIETDIRAAASTRTAQPTFTWPGFTLPRFRPLGWILAAMEAYGRFERNRRDMRRLNEMEPRMRRDIGLQDWG